MNEINYLSALQQAKYMLSNDLITLEEFILIEENLAKKYCIKSCSLYRQNCLINSPFRVINVIQKEEDSRGRN